MTVLGKKRLRSYSGLADVIENQTMTSICSFILLCVIPRLEFSPFVPLTISLKTELFRAVTPHVLLLH